MDGGDAAGMARVTGFQERECCPVTDFVNEDAIRTQSNRALKQPRHVDRVAAIERDRVSPSALDRRCLRGSPCYHRVSLVAARI